MHGGTTHIYKFVLVSTRDLLLPARTYKGGMSAQHYTSQEYVYMYVQNVREHLPPTRFHLRLEGLAEHGRCETGWPQLQISRPS